MSVPLNLIAPVAEGEVNSRRMARFTEQVCNAINALITGGVLIQSGSSEFTIDPSSLPPSGVTADTYTNPTISINTQGLITAAADGSAVAFVQEDGGALTQRDTLNFGTALTASDDAGNSRTNVVLANTAVTPNTYTNATITVDAQGRLTSAASGTASGISPLTTKGDIWGFSTLDARFPVTVGDGAIIIQDAAATFGFKWIAVSGDLTSAASGAFTIANDAVSYAKMQNVSAASRILGRGSAGGSGDVQEITVGSGLIMDGTSLETNPGTVGGGPVVVVKTADESLQNNTLQDDDELLFPIGASETWVVEFTLFVLGPATADIKFAVNAPASASGFVGIIGLLSGLGSGAFLGDAVMYAIADVTDTGAAGVATSSTAQALMVRFSAVIVNSTNAGNVILRWAQINTIATNTTVKAGSYLIAHRFA